MQQPNNILFLSNKPKLQELIIFIKNIKIYQNYYKKKKKHNQALSQFKEEKKWILTDRKTWNFSMLFFSSSLSERTLRLISWIGTSESSMSGMKEGGTRPGSAKMAKP